MSVGAWSLRNRGISRSEGNTHWSLPVGSSAVRPSWGRGQEGPDSSGFGAAWCVLFGVFLSPLGRREKREKEEETRACLQELRPTVTGSPSAFLPTSLSCRKFQGAPRVISGSPQGTIILRWGPFGIAVLLLPLVAVPCVSVSFLITGPGLPFHMCNRSDQQTSGTQ